MTYKYNYFDVGGNGFKSISFENISKKKNNYYNENEYIRKDLIKYGDNYNYVRCELGH